MQCTVNNIVSRVHVLELRMNETKRVGVPDVVHICIHVTVFVSSMRVLSSYSR